MPKPALPMDVGKATCRKILQTKAGTYSKTVITIQKSKGGKSVEVKTKKDVSVRVTADAIDATMVLVKEFIKSLAVAAGDLTRLREKKRVTLKVLKHAVEQSSQMDCARVYTSMAGLAAMGAKGTAPTGAT